MGSLALDAETVDTGIFLFLGLKESRKVLETPKALSLLSSFLERAVQRNEKSLETTKKRDKITVFHGLRAPNLSIQHYIDRIFKYSNCSPSCFILAQIYMDRFFQQLDVHLTSLNVHRLLITSVMVAAKFIDDAFFNNAFYARVGGVSTLEMNRLEMKFLFSLNFRLQVDLRTFESYCLKLKKDETFGMYQMERLSQGCGLKGLTNKEETKSQQYIKRFSCGAIQCPSNIVQSK